MKSGTGIAAGLAAGYLLGRRRKLLAALLVGTALATGKAGRFGNDVLKRTVGAIGPDGALEKVSPEIGKLSGLITDQLVAAGKAAAMAAVTGRLDSLADSIPDPDPDNAQDEKASRDDATQEQTRQSSSRQSSRSDQPRPTPKRKAAPARSSAQRERDQARPR
jgi:hypothetical protein